MPNKFKCLINILYSWARSKSLYTKIHIPIYGSFANTVLISTAQMGNDVIYMLISYFYLTLYGSYSDRICSDKFILSHWYSVRLFNSLFTSLGK